MIERDEDRLAELLVRWDEDKSLSPGELCRDVPHLAEELSRRVRALEATAWLDAPLDLVPLPSTPCEPCGTESMESRILGGRYRLDEPIAEGGFAKVWKGFDLELHRVVAVKVPKRSRPDMLDGFLAEARKTARLKHPGIVPIFDTGGCSTPVGQQPGTCFLVSEYVEGGSLAERVGQPMAAADVVRIGAEIAEALQHAHEQGFIHRDIKPNNILIDRHGRARLTDFGIAVADGEEGTLVRGTLRYMSPEQAAGLPVDVRSDLYSLGVVIQLMLTGSLPFPSPDASMDAIASRPDAAEENEARADLVRICRKLMQRAPNDRYANAADLASDLRRIHVRSDR
jgi:eukaryotic-like serine/threonine-protein kinase